MNLSQETLRTIVGVTTLVCAGIGIYAGIKAEMATMTSVAGVLTDKVVELDKYDILLQNSIDSSKERIIRLEAQMEGQTKNYDRLIDTMDNLGDKLEVLGTKITEIKVSN